MPIIEIIPSDCGINGRAIITNFNPNFTYTFNPAATVDQDGEILGLTPSLSYTVSASNSICVSNTTAPFMIQPALIIPDAPVVSTTGGNCNGNGEAQITNYDLALQYTITPNNSAIQITSTGLITGLAVFPVTYTIIASNGVCDSEVSNTFFINEVTVTPAIPIIEIIEPTCDAAGRARITNYDPNLTYTFNPTGATVDGDGFINGMTPNDEYTVFASNGACPSDPTAPFEIEPVLVTPVQPLISFTPQNCSGNGTATITNHNINFDYIFTPVGPSVTNNGQIIGLVAGTFYSVIATNGDCESIASLPFFINPITETPDIPTITVAPATCNTVGVASITNFNPNYDYTFNPSGPTVTASGLIQNFVCGIAYTVFASNGPCDTDPSDSFTIECQLPIPLPAAFTITNASCSGNGTATITPATFNSANTYTFTPPGPSVDGTGLIVDVVCDINYTVQVSNGGCNATSTSNFSVGCQTPTPAVAIVNVVGATCLVGGDPCITNFNPNCTYTFTPAGPFVISGGCINNIQDGVNYTVTVTCGGCTSAPSPSFNNGPLTVPPTVTFTVTDPTCTTPGSAVIDPFNNTYTYIFTPAGPTVNATGQIENFVFGTSYTIIASNGSCSSLAPSLPLIIRDALGVPDVPIVINTTAADCFENQGAQITNFDANATYVFNPAAPSAVIDDSGNITGLSANTSYTVVAQYTFNGVICPSAASAPFVVLPQLPVPQAPIINLTAATCSANEQGFITNYDPALIYSFNPAGPTINPTTFEILGAIPGNQYRLTVFNTPHNCSNFEDFIIAPQFYQPQDETSNGFICVDENGVTVQTFDLITNESNPPDNGFIWTFTNLSGVTITLPTAVNFHTANEAGTYVATVTTPNGCVAIKTFNIVALTKPVITNVLVERWFEQNVRVTVLTRINGNYLYRFNDEPWQQSNVFENVPAGEFTVYVMNAEENGCGADSEIGRVVNYPPFFTPNGDGFNDTWNIIGLENQPESKIDIFDRFGKLVAQIKPTPGTGWNGTYNGQPLPSSDYWFTVEYVQGIERKTFKAHFSLKR